METLKDIEENKLKLRLYHGTKNLQIDLDNLKPNLSSARALDQMLGVHFSVDPTIAEYFGHEGKGKILTTDIELLPSEILDIPPGEVDADGIEHTIVNILDIDPSSSFVEITSAFKTWARQHGIKAIRYRNTQHEEIYHAKDDTCYILL